MNPMLKESDDISALTDGMLQGEEFANALDRLSRDGDARMQWHAYHVVGDVLRSTDLASAACNTKFLERLQSRLESETFDRPAASTPVGVVGPNLLGQPAANGETFRWKVAAGFASVAAVVAIGWNAVGLMNVVPDRPAFAVQGVAGQELALSQASTTASGVGVANNATTEPQVMLRNAQLDELLAAHSQVVGGAALQTQPGYVRNASFANAAR